MTADPQLRPHESLRTSAPVRAFFVSIWVTLAMAVTGAAMGQSPAAAPSTSPASGAAQPPASKAFSPNPLFAKFPKPPADLPFLSADQAWPARYGRQPADPVQGAIIEMDRPMLKMEGAHFLPSRPADDSPEAKVIRALAPAADPAPPFIFEGPNSFAFFPDSPGPGEKIAKRRLNRASETFRFVSAQQEHHHDGTAVTRLERTWFSVFDPIPVDAQPAPQPRGVILLMPGLFGTPEGVLERFTTELCTHGWVVLRMLSQPSRFTERTAFEFSAKGDLAAQAKQVAGVFTDRTAECAYSSQAAFDHLEQKRPELKGLPSIAIGFSGGAMTLPTVVAREPQRYSAAIMVGGGADFWLMNEKSNYRSMIDAVHETWAEGEPGEEVRARLDRLYLEACPMDSYHTAASLKGKPVLLIQGTADQAVPSPLGDLLWERLGKPDRWLEEDEGHEVLFMTLPQEFGKILEWLDKAVPLPAPSPAPDKVP